MTVARGVGTIIIITIIRKDVLNVLVAYDSRIAVNAVHLVYVGFVVELVVVPGSIHLRNRNVKRTTSDTYIVIDF